VRLNGTSDLPWEDIAPDIILDFPRVQFYDYTKSVDRARAFGVGDNWPANYHLTYSLSEKDVGQASDLILTLGVSVAVVFSDFLPEFYLGAPVIDGNRSDWRFKDAPGSIVGLLAKARAKGGAAFSEGFTVDPCGPCDLNDPNGPAHNGSILCRNAKKSIAAGGNVAHCTCNACF
jgi:hypothetical protein